MPTVSNRYGSRLLSSFEISVVSAQCILSTVITVTARAWPVRPSDWPTVSLSVLLQQFHCSGDKHQLYDGGHLGPDRHNSHDLLTSIKLPGDFSETYLRRIDMAPKKK